MTSQELAGRRLIVLLFDTSSMQPEDVQRAIDSANKYVSEQMSPADLIAVATVSSPLDVLTDFTGDRAKVAQTLARLGMDRRDRDSSTRRGDRGHRRADGHRRGGGSDRGHRARHVQQRRPPARAANAGGCAGTARAEEGHHLFQRRHAAQRAGQPDRVAHGDQRRRPRARLDLSRGHARAPGGRPGRRRHQASGRGQSLFSGRGVRQQFGRLAASQDTLTSLAADTGGRAFTDTNDFGEAFTRVRRDMSAYYLLGYSSSDPSKDGRFRRIQVRVKTEGYRVEARAGYFAERDFAHTSRTDRETQLQEQMFSAVSSTDLPVMVSGGFFRLAADRYYVPISVAVPGYAVPVKSEKEEVSLDVLGIVMDEQGRPLGRMRETLKFPGSTSKTLSGKQVLYSSGVTLPPGRFSVKVVVRENTTGKMGSFETALAVPELKQAPVKVSSVVLSTQLQQGARGRNRQSARARRRAARSQPHARREQGPEAVLLLRGLRAGRGRGRAASAHEPRVLSRQGQSVRDAGRRARRVGRA